MNVTASQILYKGAELIAEHGHAKGVFETPAGALCAAGALGRACRDLYPLTTDTVRVRNAAVHALAASLDAFQREAHVVTRWNDLPETSAEDVILRMKQVAAELEEAGK